MTPVVEGAGVALDYSESGSGATVLLVHGIGGSDWPDLPGRVIGYSRRGYGSSGAPEMYARTTVEEQAEDASALLRALDAAPAVAVGDGLGALIALDVARRYGALVRGVVAIDPPLFEFVPEASESLSAESDELEGWVREHGPAEAARRWASAHGRDPDAVGRDFRAFFADYGAAATWPVGRRELRAVSTSLIVLTSPDASPHLLAAADALVGAVPGASLGAELSAAVSSLLAA